MRSSYKSAHMNKQLAKFAPSRGENPKVSANKATIEKSAIKVFITRDCDRVTFADLEEASGIRKATILNYYREGKEPIIVNAAKILVQAQSDVLKDTFPEDTKNDVLYYASMVALHIYMADRNANINKLYERAYLLPESQDFLYRLMTERVKGIGSRNTPEYQIASVGILREMIATPNNHYMTVSGKVECTVRMTLEFFGADEEIIKKALAFVSALELEALSEKVTSSVLK